MILTWICFAIVLAVTVLYLWWSVWHGHPSPKALAVYSGVLFAYSFVFTVFAVRLRGIADGVKWPLLKPPVINEI